MVRTAGRPGSHRRGAIRWAVALVWIALVASALTVARPAPAEAIDWPDPRYCTEGSIRSDADGAIQMYVSIESSAGQSVMITYYTNGSGSFSHSVNVNGFSRYTEDVNAYLAGPGRPLHGRSRVDVAVKVVGARFDVRVACPTYINRTIGAAGRIRAGTVQDSREAAHVLACPEGSVRNDAGGAFQTYVTLLSEVNQFAGIAFFTDGAAPVTIPAFLAAHRRVTIDVNSFLTGPGGPFEGRGDIDVAIRVEFEMFGTIACPTYFDRSVGVAGPVSGVAAQSGSEPAAGPRYCAEGSLRRDGQGAIQTYLTLFSRSTQIVPVALLTNGKGTHFVNAPLVADRRYTLDVNQYLTGPGGPLEGADDVDVTVRASGPVPFAMACPVYASRSIGAAGHVASGAVQDSVAPDDNMRCPEGSTRVDGLGALQMYVTLSSPRVPQPVTIDYKTNGRGTWRQNLPWVNAQRVTIDVNQYLTGPGGPFEGVTDLDVAIEADAANELVMACPSYFNRSIGEAGAVSGAAVQDAV